MTTIRPANPSDLPWLLAQLREFAAFFGSKRSLFPESDADARAIVGALIQTQPFFVAQNFMDDRVGFIAGHLGPHPYNPSLTVLAELFWWVTPSARHTSVGARLLAVFEAYGREHADSIVMTLEAKSPVNPASLERRGYALYERSYLLEV